MIKALFGIGFAVIAFFDYCCCRASGLAEKRLDYLLPANQRDENEQNGSNNGSAS